jgi:hypothetical protein
MNRVIRSRRLGPDAFICYSDGVNDTVRLDATTTIWGPYPNYDDIARFDYGRLLWRSADMRTRLLAHWLDERHPYRERFIEQRELIEEVLTSTKSPIDLNVDLLNRGSSLRCVAREIPPVFGSFF